MKSYLKLPKRLGVDFTTVDLILHSNAKTKNLDAFILTFAKYEKQLRKLLSFLVYSHPAVGKKNWKDYESKIIESKNLDYRTTPQLIDKLIVGEIFSQDEIKMLKHKVEEIGELYRNKIFHGQRTGERLRAKELKQKTSHIVELMGYLACAAKQKVDYDGMERDVSKAAEKAKYEVNCKDTFNDLTSFEGWLKKKKKLAR